MCVAALALFSSCDVDVVLGFNLRAGDAGDDAGAIVDGGEIDGGANDGGAIDGGSSDGGSSDGGSSDGGSSDGGSTDAGSTDAGIDAGQSDGGPADLIIALELNLAAEPSTTIPLDVVVTNQGGTAAGGLSRVTLPTGLSWVNGSGCGEPSAGLIECTFTPIAPGAQARQRFNVLSTAATGLRQLTGVITTTAPELDAGNNTTSNETCVTVPSVTTVQITPPRSVTLESCYGSVTQFSMCTPPSIITVTFDLLPDGGTDTIALGAYGRWSQSPGSRNLVMQFTSGATTTIFHCQSNTTPTCFEGFTTQPGVGGGASRACLN